jgi:hypothetical protein
VGSGNSPDCMCISSGFDSFLLLRNMDLLAFYKVRHQNADVPGNSGGGKGTVCVWDLSSDSPSVLGLWENIAADKLCLSGAAIRLGILSNLTGVVTVHEIVSKAIIFQLQYDCWIGYAVGLVCNVACDKVAVIGSSSSVVYDVNAEQQMYEFRNAYGIVFSHDNAFVYAQYKTKIVQCDVVTGAELKVFEDSTRITVLFSVMQSPCGSRIAWQTELNEGRHGVNGQIVVLNTISEEIQTTFRYEARRVFCFRDAGALIVSGFEFVEFCDVETGGSVPSVVKIGRATDAAAVVGDSATMFRLSPGGIRVVDLTTGMRTCILTCPVDIFSDANDTTKYCCGLVASNQQQTILM